MILKSFEISKIDVSKFKFFLIYGDNEGLKKELISKIKDNHIGKEIKYEESEIIGNKFNFLSEIKNRSLFDEKKNLLY